MKRILAVAALAILASGAHAQADAPLAAAAPGARSFSAVYSVIGSRNNVTFGDFNYALKLEDGRYEATASRRITGMFRAIIGDQQDYSYSVRGRVTPSGLAPQAYQHRGGKRDRTVRVAFAGGTSTTTAEPVMGMGNPPATPEQRAGAIDQVSAIAAMITASGNPCERTIKVLMDGRARFDFVMTANGAVQVNSRAYRGEAMRCRVQLRPIAGFPDPQGPATLTFLFARTSAGLYAPLRIEMPTDEERIGVAVLQARSFTAN